MKPTGKFDKPDRDNWTAAQCLLPPEISARLRYARFTTGQTAQQIMVSALDQVLPFVPESAHLRKCGSFESKDKAAV